MLMFEGHLELDFRVWEAHSGVELLEFATVSRFQLRPTPKLGP